MMMIYAQNCCSCSSVSITWVSAKASVQRGATWTPSFVRLTPHWPAGNSSLKLNHVRYYKLIVMYNRQSTHAYIVMDIFIMCHSAVCNIAHRSKNTVSIQDLLLIRNNFTKNSRNCLTHIVCWWRHPNVRRSLQSMPTMTARLMTTISLAQSRR